MSEHPKFSSTLLPWRTRIQISLLTAVTDFSRRSNGTVNRRLISYFDLTTKPPTKPVQGVKVSDISVDPSRNLWFRLFVPTDSTGHANLPVMVFFHGGGFTFLSAESKLYDAVCRRFALEIPVVVLSVNYRLSPEHQFPAQYDDGFDILKFLDEQNIEGLPANTDLSCCFLAGDSAGGNISHNVARRAAETEFRKVKVIGLIPIQPFFGGEERTESEIRLGEAPFGHVKRTDWHWKVYLPQGSDRDHEACNVFGPKSTDISGLKNFPVTLLFVGGFDPLQDWQRRYYEGLNRNGKEAYLKEYPNAIHGFYLFPNLPQASLLFTDVKAFVRKQCSKSMLSRGYF